MTPSEIETANFRLAAQCLKQLRHQQRAPAPIITGINFVFTFHMSCIVSYLYSRIISASFFIKLMSPEIAASINIHVPFFIMTYYDAQFIVRKGSVGLHSLIP